MTKKKSGAFAFTIVELLVVITIIIVLAGLILSTVGYVQKKGARSRAEAEIAAISAACESYKADNGAYPRGNAANPGSGAAPFDTDSLDARTAANPMTYAHASLFLYEILMADNDADGGADGKTYMQLKPNQLARPDMSQAPSASNHVLAIRDPFGNYYGYSTAYTYDVEQNQPPTHGYNPTFDLWSTGGVTRGTDQTQWIKNW